MCVVSMVGDHFADKWDHYNPIITTDVHTFVTGISRFEFDALKKEVEEMKELLKRAKLYDEQTGQPDCENEGKMALLRKIAEAVGINLDDVLKP